MFEGALEGLSSIRINFQIIFFRPLEDSDISASPPKKKSFPTEKYPGTKPLNLSLSTRKPPSPLLPPPTGRGGGDAAGVQADHHDLPADACQEPLRLQPSRLLPRRLGHPPRAQQRPQLLGEAGATLAPRGLQGLPRQTVR